MRKNSHKNHFLVLSLIIFFSFSVSILVFSPVSFVNMAKALSPVDYNKLTGASLGVADWNRLDDDFVAKSGDAMTGFLTLSGDPTLVMQAATKQYVDDQITSVNTVDAATGDQIKIVCGRTSVDATAWVLVNAADKRVKVTVDTSGAGFSSTPYYLVSLAGDMYNNRNIGGQSVHSPTVTSFVVAPQYTGPLAFNDSVARSWKWHITWCAFGN